MNAQELSIRRSGISQSGARYISLIKSRLAYWRFIALCFGAALFVAWLTGDLRAQDPPKNCGSSARIVDGKMVCDNAPNLAATGNCVHSADLTPEQIKQVCDTKSTGSAIICKNGEPGCVTLVDPAPKDCAHARIADGVLYCDDKAGITSEMRAAYWRHLAAMLQAERSAKQFTELAQKEQAALQEAIAAINKACAPQPPTTDAQGEIQCAPQPVAPAKEKAQ